MKYCIALLLLCLLAYQVNSIKPGTIVGIREELLNQARDQYFTVLMLGFQYLSYDNVENGSTRLAGISGSLSNEKSSNCKIGFDEGRNALTLNMTKSELDLHMNWAADSKEGVVDLKGDISFIEMFMQFSTVDVDGELIPQINFDEVNVHTEESDLKLDYTCDGCEESTINKIEDIVKNTLLDKVKSEALDLVNERVSGIVNLQLKTMVPTEFPISPDITIDLSSTGPIEVKSEYIAVSLDSTVYLNEDGYNRPMDPPDIDVIHPDNPGQILLFTSDYVYKCLEQIMNKHSLSFDFHIYGQNVTVEIDPERVPFELESEEDYMHLHAGGIATIPSFNSYLEFGVNTKLDLDLYRGDQYNMFLLHPKIVGASFSTIKISVFGFEMDLSAHVIPYLDQIAAALLNLVFFPQLSIPKLEALPLKASEAKLEFHTNYTELGASFTLG